jgi:hypothetical protein
LSIKKTLAVIAIVVVLFSAWLVYARHKSRLAEDRGAQAQRDAAYQATLVQIQQELPAGTRRDEVRKALQSRKMLSSETDKDIEVGIGQDPGDGLVCDRWNVYLDFRFEHPEAQIDPSPMDKLQSISIKKLGHCS